ncbi:hypothetical protein SAY87_025818 [Trapa incisa]|uniref:Uncharacterized protein n=1 Tax=Trapa incisa TaxID=236973 RepID=A0AAN7JCK9_9MYRT|nr:hypothetical protein SAY87_025818 [Trapa incisa]
MLLNSEMLTALSSDQFSATELHEESAIEESKVMMKSSVNPTWSHRVLQLQAVRRRRYRD